MSKTEQNSPIQHSDEEIAKMAEDFLEAQEVDAEMYGSGDAVMTDKDWSNTFSGMNNEADDIEAIIRGEKAKQKSLRDRVPDATVDHMFLASTINELVASPGAGKSTFTARLAACLADPDADNFLGYFRVTTGRVVVYSEDVTGFKAMLRAIDLAEGSEVSDRVMVTSNFPNLMGYEKHPESGLPVPSRALNSHINALRTWADGEKISLIVFDTKSALMSSCVRPNGKAMEENSNDDQQAISNHALMFVKEFNATGLFLAHPTKAAGSSDSRVMDSRGGGAAKGAMWKTFTLRKAKGGGTTFTPDKQRGNGFSCSLALHATSCPTEVAEDIPELLELYNKPFSLPPDALPQLPGMVNSPFSAYVLANEAEIVGDEDDDKKEDGRSARKGKMMWTDKQKEIYEIFIGKEVNGRAEKMSAIKKICNISGYEYNTVKSALQKMVTGGHISQTTEGRGNEAVQIYTAKTQAMQNPLTPWDDEDE